VAEPVTWTIAALTEWLDAVIAGSLGGEIWVEGEISGLQRHAASGHVYFTLVGEDTGDGAPPKLAVTLFRWNKDLVNLQLRRAGGAVRMGDGVRVRIKGSVQLYPARSQYQLRMTAIDPAFTLGNLAAARAELLARLGAEDLLEANRRHVLAEVPLRVALVTSVGSAAYHDAVEELRAAAVGFEVLVVDARVQGQDAPESIVAALARAAALGPDLVALVRGGGARTDLVAFDDEAVARAVATLAVPVWCGLGHEIDRSVVDEVAHRSFKTPTACAAAVVERVLEAGGRSEAAFEEILARADHRLHTAGQRVGRRSSAVALRAGARLEHASHALEAAAHRARGRTERRIATVDAHLDAAARTVVEAPFRRLDRAAVALERAEALRRAFDPARTLARGWSITRTADGTLVRDATVAPGTELVTAVADGSIRSRVTGADPSTGTVAADG